MEAKMASLSLDTKQKEKVSRNITTLPTIVLEKIISNLDFLSRPKLSTTNKFFGEFVPTVMLKLDEVGIHYDLSRIMITVVQFQSKTVYFGSRRFILNFTRAFFPIWHSGRNEEDCLMIRQCLEKLLNNKMVKVDKLHFGGSSESGDRTLHDSLFTFPKKISCRKVEFSGRFFAETVENLLKRMNIDMEEISIYNHTMPESISRLEQMRTADCVLLDLHYPTSSFIYECIDLKKVHINVIEFVKGEGRVIIKSSIRDLIERWRNGDRQQLREIKIHLSKFSYEKVVAEIRDIRMTSSRYVLKEEEGALDIHKNFRIDKFSTDSTVIGHANIHWHETWKVDMDRLPEQMKTRLRNGVETLEEIPLDDGILTSLYESVFTVTFEDYP